MNVKMCRVRAAASLSRFEFQKQDRCYKCQWAGLVGGQMMLTDGSSWSSAACQSHQQKKKKRVKTLQQVKLGGQTESHLQVYRQQAEHFNTNLNLM